MLGLLCSLLGVLPTRAGAQQVSAAGAGDGVLRWVDRATDPIRVWVQGGEQVPGWKTGFRTSVREALAIWNDVGLPVRLAEVTDSATAEVHVVWVERLGHGESGRAVRWSTPTGRMRRARIMLGTLDCGGGQQTPGSMRAVALHELGHVLGLGHATDARDIMAPWIEVSTLSDADRQSALRLYQLPAGPVGAPGGAVTGPLLVDGAKLARGGVPRRRVFRRDVSFPAARGRAAGKAPA